MGKRWLSKEISFGDAVESSTVRVSFKGTEDLPEIMDIKAGCPSCTGYKFDRDKKELHVSIKLGKIPVHLRMEGKSQSVNKIVRVKYFDGMEDILTITGQKHMA